MMKPGERFVLLRTGERYVVDGNGAIFNESRNRPAKLHGNCEVEPIKTPKREWVGLTDEERHQISLDNRPYCANIMRAHEEELKRRNT
jgi:hypothetical protein